MVVFRNAQGSFLPAMSDDQAFQYWRILKVGASKLGEPLKGGDTIRFCWMFDDQVNGVRDYVGDVFGRRQMIWPAEVESKTLYLKVPWPRFEVSNTPTSMIMSTESGTEEVAKDIRTLPRTLSYVLQDIQFRIDLMESPVGDANDYMLRKVRQEMDRETVSFIVGYSPRPPGNALQLVDRIFRFGVTASR